MTSTRSSDRQMTSQSSPDSSGLEIGYDPPSESSSLPQVGVRFSEPWTSTEDASVRATSSGDVLPRTMSSARAEISRAWASMRSVGGRSTPGGRARSGEIEARILAGQTALRSLRLRVSGTMLACGVGFAVLAQWGYLSDEADLDGPMDGLSWLASIACMVLLAVAPLPDARWLTVLVVTINATIVGIDIVWNLEGLVHISNREGDSEDVDGCEHPTMDVPSTYCAWKRVLYIGYVSLGIGFCCGSLAVLVSVFFAWHLSQQGMWLVMKWYFALMTLVDLVVWAAFTLLLGYFARDVPAWYLAGDLFGFVASAVPRFRQRFHVILRAMLHRTGSQAAAAGIASLVGDCDPGEIRRQANERFCSISLAGLKHEDLASNAPSTELAALTKPTRLGLCDAFISHSWHDCAKTKWCSLDAWRRDFVASKSREPSVWIDKCCIDQNNIDVDLRCLPIFISGCEKMIVFCGVTYLSRLWCIMELFTFVHMGGDPEAIELHLLLREGSEEEDRSLISSSIHSFDAGQCKCSSEADSDRMLEIINTAYGDLEEFNVAVRGIIAKTCAGHFSDIVLSSSSDSDVESLLSDSTSSESPVSACFSL